jgi:uncharacterized damage-inducible protein DinB
MQQIKWTDRKFFFGYDKGYIPLFIERLYGTAPRMEELLNSSGEHIASIKEGDGWSIKEHAGHLTDLERLHDGRIDDIIAGLTVLRAADMSNKDTYAANHNERTIPELLTQFRKTRNEFIERVRSLNEKYFETKALHPRLKEMVTMTDLLFFMAEHDNHHLARIAQLSLQMRP